MAWNEPGNNGGDKKDPWGKGGKDQPPDLDELFRNLQDKMSRFFGGTSGGRDGGGDSAAMNMSFFTVLAIAIIIYVLSGIYVVRPYELAAVFQFGRYVETVGPGPHWIPPFIRTKEVAPVNLAQLSKHSGSLMLTKDDNLVEVSLSVSYEIDDLANYLLKVQNPENSLKQVTDSALRQVIGHSTLDDILTGGREKVRDQIESLIIALMSEYETGLKIKQVALESAEAPEQVKDAFDDVIKAREDEQKAINQATAYMKQKIPIANGNSQRMILQGEAYKANVVERAKGDIARFEKLLPEYELAPEVTRKRLYLDTMRTVLSNSSKVVIDSKNSNNLLYLPIDKLIQQSAAKHHGNAVSSLAKSGNTRSSTRMGGADRLSGRQTASRSRDIATGREFFIRGAQ